MTEEKLYLRQNVLVEPLINRWYAWPYLIPPASAAMYLESWHLELLRTFVATPQFHIAAQNDPAMRGGPFIDCPIECVDEIKNLLEKTLQGSEALLQFAAAFKSFDKKLQTEATGYSLETLYAAMPEPLQGYVELVYDLHNRPSMRLIEGLLYKSQYYQTLSQSITFSLIHRDDRTFVLTTPRLDDPQSLNLQIPFAHAGLDQLFAMKTVPQSFEYIKQCLKIQEHEDLFRTFFTEEVPRSNPAYQGEDVRIHYYGHACLLIQTAKTSILVDPLISYKFDDHNVPRYTFEDLPEKIDYVLITHNHQDHCLFEVLLQLRHKVGTIVVPRSIGGELADPSLKLILKSIGFRNVIDMDEMEEIQVEDGLITGLPFLGEHSDLDIRTKLAYLIQLKGRSILCVADSNNLQPKLYEHLHALIGDIDVLFVGMECDGAPLTWVYGPLLTKLLPRKMDQTRRLNGSDCKRAIGIVERFNPQQVYVYAMGQEPWVTHLTSIAYTEESQPIVESNQLMEECSRRGIVCERLFGRKELFLSP